MPLNRIKNTWEYCSYNKPFFVFILIIIFILNMIPNNFSKEQIFSASNIVEYIIFIILSGYGMSITRDRINHGYRLPKIMPKLVIELGIKSFIVNMAYITFQLLIFSVFFQFLNLPEFNLLELIISYSDTVQLFFTHDIIQLLIFFILGGSIFYI